MAIDVSVIMAAYNAETTIQDSINSVLDQSVTSIELIIVDDGSTDRTAAILRSISDPRVRVISQSNKGPSAARNTAAEYATGTWLACIDADDLWANNKLEMQLKSVSGTSPASVTYCWADIVNESGQLLFSDQRIVCEGDVFDQLLRGNFIVSGSNTLINRQVFKEIGGFNPDLNAAEDWELHTRLASRHRFACTRSALVKYRLRKNSLSTCLDTMEKDWWKASNFLFSLQKENSISQNESASTFYFYLATRALQTQRGLKRVQTFTKYIATALRLAPATWPKAILVASPMGSIKGLLRMRR